MAMPQTVRHINERRLLDALSRRGALSRAELGRELELTRSTAGNLVTSLAEAGFVREGAVTDREMGETRVGRPGSLVELNAAHAVFLGAEIGVGRIRIIGIDLSAAVICQTESRFDPDRCDPSAVADLLVAAVKRLRTWTAPAHVRGLGIAVAGLISPDGNVIRAPFLRWQDVPLQSLIETRLSGFYRIMAENDANAFALAELSRAAEDPPTDAVYLLLDVGVGGGIVSNGELVRGRHGSAGEIGHLPLVDHGGNGDVRPGSTPRGSFESLIGTEALLADHRRRGGPAQGLPEFLAAVKQRQPTAEATVALWAEHLGRGLAVLSAVLDPDRFVFGGPASVLLESCRTAVEGSLHARLLPSQKLPSIALSQFGEDAPAIGAALMLQQRFLALDFDPAIDRPELGRSPALGDSGRNRPESSFG